VRLKSGDPLVYGRAGEEMAALRDAGVSYEVVPGITSAFAAAADFELPLTLRGVASSLVFTTGHDLTGDVLPDWAVSPFRAPPLPSIWAARLPPTSPGA
jgi:uroporphyrin-III C-methyltransferase/precorrin-2 dehydrogenase/sirohydrochlorin ferrochelatase